MARTRDERLGAKYGQNRIDITLATILFDPQFSMLGVPLSTRASGFSG